METLSAYFTEVLLRFTAKRFQEAIEVIYV